MKNLVSTELYSFDQTSMYVKAVSLLPVTFLELKRFLKIVNTSENMVSIPGISTTYMLNKSLEKNKGLELYSPGAFVTYAEIYKKSSSTVVVMVP